MKSCPNQEALFGYLVGAIPEQTAEQIAQHVDACQECERTVQALEGLSDTVITALRHQVRSDTFAEEPALQQAVSRLRQVTARKVESDTRASVESPQTETTPARTKKLGDYELLKKLGQGGMGTVYKARHTKLKRIVALKVLPKNRLASAEAVARFEREMEAVGRLDHPNIVRAMDAREVAGIRFLVMEHVDGLDLAEICNRGGSLNIPDACEVVRQAALGLQCSQENGLVHRDVKPSNLMLTTSGEVKILDLGLAHIQEAESSEGEVTGVGQIMGTPDYMSPEQALESHNVDIRTDVYSLGCTFYRLLADRAPFSGLKYDTAMKKVAAHLHDEADPIQLLRPDLPKPIAMLIERMLSKDPHDRPSTPSAVVDALAPFCQGSKLIGLLRDASRKKRLAAETEASDVETGDLRGSDDVETSRDGPPVQEAAVKPSGAGDLDPYHRWLGIPKAEQPANRYRLLGIAKFEDDPEVIRDAAARQMAHVRTYQLGPHAEMSQKILNELGAAKACLLNEKKRAAYDAQLRAERAPPVTDAPKQRRPKPAAPKRRPATPKPRSATPPPHPATPKMPVAHVEPRRTATVARPFAERWNPPTWVWVAASAAGFFVLLSIVLFIMTGKGRIKITLSDPRARVEIKVDGDTIDIIGLEEPLRLRAGQHELVVSGSGFKTIGRKFTVRRGNNHVLEIELIPLATGPRAPLETQVARNDGSQDAKSSSPPESTSTSGDTQGQRDPLSPTQAVRIAIVTGEDITAHNWRESSQALKEVLQENRQLTADVIEDPGFLASEKLFDYQVVVLNFNNENPLPQELQARNNLAGFVEQGRGLILIHAASRAFFGWDKFGEIAGRTMARPPTHDPIREITVHVVDRSHPITQGLANFQVRDELYTCLEGDWPIQVLATARSVVTGADYPMAFVSNYGDGRVFHLSLGHSADAIRSADVATMIRRGAAWVAVPSLGDQQPSASDATTAPATQRTVRLSNWEDLKYGMFIHFGMSTFTERNADRGDSPSTTYAPSQLDVPQWIEVAKKSGMKYVVLTAKHHSGHCLWNGTSTDYDVSTSANTTDVVAEFMRACHLEGIKPGIYYSIADGHNEPGAELQWRTPVSQSYFQLIKQQITELHTRHSDIYEQWLDLAGKLNGAQRQELYTLIKKLNPNCLVAMSGQGKGSITGYLSLWPTDILSMYGMPHRSVQHDPNRFWLGETYHLPLEVHATIGKRWWYQASDPVKTTKEFRALWRSTAGKGANLLLNVPPDRTGRIPQAYINVLREYKKIIDQESG